MEIVNGGVVNRELLARLWLKDELLMLREPYTKLTLNLKVMSNGFMPLCLPGS